MAYPFGILFSPRFIGQVSRFSTFWLKGGDSLLATFYGRDGANYSIREFEFLFIRVTVKPTFYISTLAINSIAACMN